MTTVIWLKARQGHPQITRLSPYHHRTNFSRQREKAQRRSSCHSFAFSFVMLHRQLIHLSISLTMSRIAFQPLKSTVIRSSIMRNTEWPGLPWFNFGTQSPRPALSLRRANTVAWFDWIECQILISKYTCKCRTSVLHSILKQVMI